MTNLLTHFDNRKCGCIVRGDGQWLRMCDQHGLIHRQQLFAKYPGLTSEGTKKRHRGQGHTSKTHGSDYHGRSLARAIADYEAGARGVGSWWRKKPSA